jgi:hypothetical protein
LLQQHGKLAMLATTDGCEKQYKCIVDAVNGVDKNTILRRSMRRKVQSADDALSASSSTLQVHSFNNVASEETYSAAEDCKRILEMEGGEGVKSGVKREKRMMKNSRADLAPERL